MYNLDMIKDKVNIYEDWYQMDMYHLDNYSHNLDHTYNKESNIVYNQLDYIQHNYYYILYKNDIIIYFNYNKYWQDNIKYMNYSNKQYSHDIFNKNL